MNVINFGSLNFDYFYEVRHFVRPGETITSDAYRRSCGGKGLNQSIALARAGARVFHAGKVGKDGDLLLTCLRDAGVDTGYVSVSENRPSGHAIIQVDPAGQNSIIIHGGANQEVLGAEARRVLGDFKEGDALLLQNEISSLAEIIECGGKQGLTIYLNPAPMTRDLLACPLDRVDYFIINEIEGRELTGAAEPGEIIRAMRKRFPRSVTILTLGERGVIGAWEQSVISAPAESVRALDTTAAGDTFTGFFVAQRLRGAAIEDCLRVASHAAAICVTRRGSADSIPFMAEVASRVAKKDVYF
jgi:ribokinase